MMHKLLTREQFKEQTFARDKGLCVVCGEPAVDAHHIMDRQLFEDGGYYLNNGASVCAEHHMDCETTKISVREIRNLAGIKHPVIPPQLFEDQEYDKWGNSILNNGLRTRGELFAQEGVQKALASAGFLSDFTHYIKHPRTNHMPWSENIHDDDRVIPSMDAFVGKRVIVTEKMDGENTAWYEDYCHARSIDGRHHASRDWAKGQWAARRHDIPAQWRISLENLYAKHAIAYDDLESLILGFMVWNEKNVALSWDDTMMWFELLDIKSVPVWYDGIWDEDLIRKLWADKSTDRCEGYVVRLAEEIPFSQFASKVMKFVRKDHVQPNAVHWQRAEIIPNKMKG